MPRCKPGDICEVIDPQSKGSLVLVQERLAGPMPGVVWTCECLSPVRARNIRSGALRWTKPGEEVFIYDYCLRPLPPPPKEETPDPVVAPIEELTNA